MRLTVRVLGESNATSASSLYDNLKAYLQRSDFEVIRFPDLDCIDYSACPECELIDLLYVPTDLPLDLNLVMKFATQTEADHVGLYVEELGALIMSGGKSVLQRFCAERTLRHDIPIYETGGLSRRTWEKTARADVPLPRQLYLGLTQTCNRSCSFCVSRTFSSTMLSVETVRHLANQLRDHVYLIALTGAGEAMVHPDFWQIVEILSNNL